MEQIVFLISLILLSGMLLFKSLRIRNGKEGYSHEKLNRLSLVVERTSHSILGRVSQFDRNNIKKMLVRGMFWLKEYYAKIQNITHHRLESMSRANGVVQDVEDKKESSVFLKDVGDYKKKMREENGFGNDLENGNHSDFSSETSEVSDDQIERTK